MKFIILWKKKLFCTNIAILDPKWASYLDPICSSSEPVDSPTRGPMNRDKRWCHTGVLEAVYSAVFQSKKSYRVKGFKNGGKKKGPTLHVIISWDNQSIWQWSHVDARLAWSINLSRQTGLQLKHLICRSWTILMQIMKI